MRPFANPDFWKCYHNLPTEIQKRADKAFALLKENPRHPSLRFEKKGKGCSARVPRTPQATPRRLGLVLDRSSQRIRALNQRLNRGTNKHAEPKRFRPEHSCNVGADVVRPKVYPWVSSWRPLIIENVLTSPRRSALQQRTTEQAGWSPKDGPTKNHPGGQRVGQQRRSPPRTNWVVLRSGESVVSVCEVFQVAHGACCSERNRAESRRRSPVPSVLCRPSSVLCPGPLLSDGFQRNSKQK